VIASYCMLVHLVLRNILRNLRRLLPMIFIIVVVFAAMVLGNAILAASGSSLYHTYARQVSGDLSVAAASETNFTIFGSDQLLIGEYLVAQPIPNFAAAVDDVRQLPDVRAVAGLVSVSAVVDLEGRRGGRTLFGIDGEDYGELFPDLVLLAGALPRRGKPGIVVQDDGTPPEDRLGASTVITAQTGRSFTIREVPVTGVVSYPVDDALLNTVVLVDVETARALAGYTYGAGGDAVPDDDAGLAGDMDDLFGDNPSADPAGEDTGGIDVDALLGSNPDASDQVGTEHASARQAQTGTVPGAWNFLLVSLHDPADRAAVIGRLERSGYSEDEGYRVRDWYRTVGGNASLVRYLQYLFNAGLVFVALGATIIATNALVLSVLERTKEIGTMRALGGGKGRIGGMIALETLIVVTGAGLLGILAGAVGVEVLNGAEVVVQNQYIRILFGGESVQGSVSASLVVNHIVAAIALAAVSVLYPLKRAFAVSPREAMAA
jgi:putative ABC transport system permease protein